MGKVIIREFIRNKIALTFFVIATYFFSFFVISGFAGEEALDVSPLPVIFMGLLWGMRTGVLAGFLMIPLNRALSYLAGLPINYVILPDHHLAITLVTIISGVMGGYLNTLDKNLRQNGEKLQALAATAKDAMIIMDDEGKAAFWNPGAEDMFGYKAYEIIGREIHPLLTHKRYHDAFNKGFEGFKKTGKGSLVGKTVEFPMLRRSGEEFPVELSVSSLILNGRWHTAAIVRDITGRKAAESALKESKELYKAISLLSSDFFYSMSIGRTGELKLDRIWGAFTEITGYAPEEMTDISSWFNVVHPEDLPSLKLSEKDMLSNIKTVSQYRIITKDGTERWLLDKVYPIWDEESGHVKSYVGAVQDITEHKKALDALAESEEKFRLVFDIASDGIVLVDISLVDVPVISDANLEFCRMHGYEKHELIGKPISVILSEEGRKNLKDDAQRIISGETIKMEVFHVRKDGSEFPAEVSLGLVHIAGRPFSLGIERDITARKRSDEEEHARLMTAIEASDSIIMITDAGCGALYVNEAFEKITGSPKGDIIGKSLCAVFEDENTGGGLPQAACNAMKSGMPWSGRLKGRRKNGSAYVMDMDISSVKDSAGEIINYVAVMRDVTEKVALESVAEAMEVMNNIGYVFSGIRHEMGNPVNSIKTTLSLLRSNLGRASSETIGEYAERINSEVIRMEYLLKSLKSFNMFETPRPENVDMKAFMERLTALIKEDFERKAIEVGYLLADGSEWAFIDPRAMQQVMLNILTNASDALEDVEGAKIQIEVSGGLLEKKEKGLVVVKVSDNGTGMSEEERENLFKPFYTNKPGGTGLGLVIARRMLANMNGTIKLKSAKGSGTVVEITVPAGKPA